MPAHAPPTGPNSFIFAYIFTEKCPGRRPKAPQNGSAPPTGNPGSGPALGFNTSVSDLKSNRSWVNGHTWFRVCVQLTLQTIQGIRSLKLTCEDSYIDSKAACDCTETDSSIRHQHTDEKRIRCKSLGPSLLYLMNNTMRLVFVFRLGLKNTTNTWKS